MYRQVGNAENCPIAPMRTFQIQFALTDRGDLSLEGFGEGTKEEIVSLAYPLLDKALADAYEDETAESDEGLAPNRRAAIAQAVEQERDRIALEEAAIADPRTELGRDIWISALSAVSRGDPRCAVPGGVGPVA